MSDPASQDAGTKMGHLPNSSDRAEEAMLSGFLARYCQTPAGRVRTLLLHYGSLRGVFAAAKDNNGHKAVLHSEEAEALNLITELAAAAIAEEIKHRSVLSCGEDVNRYLRLRFSNELKECCRLLLLNSSNELICDERHSEGTTNRTAIYPREIVNRVIHHNATALIVVHNHPSGDPEPSDEDIIQTYELARVLAALGIKLLDHLIVGRQGVASLLRGAYTELAR